MALAKDWDRESADLFIHSSGARIARTTYRGKMAWWFFPASLDVPAVEYAATDAGRDEAFATSGKELPKARIKRKVKAAPDKKVRKASKEEGNGSAKDPDADRDEDDAEDEDKEESGD
ncbi:MAG TPA: hypothetical protein VJU16_01550 [Planctomycetota bacterium]|nr:hypothetical protein [Planctomycetota bacterium]